MRTVFWEDDKVKMIDQRRLPGVLEVVSYETHREVADAIRKGTDAARNAMVPVCLKDATIPHEVYSHFCGAKVLLRPASPGTGIIAGKTVRAAIDGGYDKAFTTVLDSHVTTLITAAVLFQFGTGPIKGFAVSLSLGIVINLFTALVGTKVVFDLINSNRKLDKLSI